MNASDFLEPKQQYNFLKDTHKQNCEALLDKLIQEAKVDEVSNASTVKKINSSKAEKAKLDKQLTHLKRRLIVLLVFAILCVVVGPILLIVGILGSRPLFLILGIVIAVLGIVLFILRSRTKKSKQAKLEKNIADLQGKIDELVKEAYSQVASLLSLFTSSMNKELLCKTVPLFSFNDTFLPEHLIRIEDQFGQDKKPDLSSSLVRIESGEFANNPFVLYKDFHTVMGEQEYVGTLVISWTTTVKTENGTTTVPHTQTLTARIVKPKPFYGNSTALNFYSEAAPRLSFSRTPSPLSGMNEKDANKYIAKFEKEDEKRAEKAIKKGQSYTKMANSKFEAYLNASGRDNEVEYRLMFTPLAQNNLIKLFASTEPYSDDVTYFKNKMVNTIITSHAQGHDYFDSLAAYDSYDLQEIKHKFLTYNEEFFKSIYFDFATLWSIPLFNQTSPSKYIPARKADRNVSEYETEVLLNRGNPFMFAHEDTKTGVILKNQLVSKEKGFDIVEVGAYSYEEVPDVEMVPVLGGDGKTHLVPVHYFIYNPLVKKTLAKVYLLNKDSETDSSKCIIRNKEFGIELLEIKGE